jgi:N-acetyl-anhydromuramyl-L-alanine amidase AmpD
MQFDKDGWLDEAIEIDFLQKSMDRAGHKITHLVLHGTAGGSSAENIANYFATSTVQASTHFLIGQDGHIVQGIPCSLAAWGNGALVSPRYPFPTGVNPNFYTISIEHVKASTDNSDQLTDAQKASSFRLVKTICEHYGIDMRHGDEHGGIISHGDLDSVNRARCPGPYPWDDLFAYLGSNQLQEETTMLDISQASGYFKQIADDRWQCIVVDQHNKAKYQHDIAYAILNYYRTCCQVGLNGLSQYGIPVSDEQRVPNTKLAVIQWFERGGILFDPLGEVDKVPGLPGPCYPTHVEQFYDAAASLKVTQAANDALHQQVIDLQKQLADTKAGDVTALQQELATAQDKLATASAGYKQMEIVLQHAKAGGVI